jgi:hypothetical protein
MSALQFQHFRAGWVMRQTNCGFQFLAQIRFIALIDPGITRWIENQLALPDPGRFPKQLSYARIKLRRFGETIPHPVEAQVRANEQARHFSRGYAVRIETELRLAQPSERIPTACLSAGFESFRIVQPQQNIPNWVLYRELVEIVRVEPPASQRPSINLNQDRQHSQKRFFGAPIRSHIQAEPFI